MVGRDEQSAEDAAVEWFVLLRDEDATDEDRRNHALWLRSDPSHGRAWRDVERTWRELGQLTGQGRDAGRAEIGPSTSVRRRPFATALAAGLAAAAVIGWLLMPVGLLADHRSGVGERQTVRLSDGSVVELGTNSAIDVSYGEGQRSVHLLNGEAFFTVAKDAGRPFVVTAQAGRIEVVGTAFNVKIEQGVSVAVVENSVEVSTAGQGPVRVSEREGISYGAGGISPARSIDPEEVQAWRHDQLVFRDVPLNQVLTELQRYRHGRIVLLGGDLGQRRVTAVFDTRRTDAALETIANSFGLRVLEVTGVVSALVAK